MTTDTLSTDFDIRSARRIAVHIESRAYAVKGWAVIVLGRLHDRKPMNAAACDVASSICSELKAAAWELQRDADRLGGLMGEPWQSRRGSFHSWRG